MSTPTPPAGSNPNNALDQVATFMLARARDVGVTESQILQLLGFRNAAGPIETLFNSGRSPQETIPEVVQGARDSADGALKAARQQVEQAIPVVVVDELKPTVRKLGMLNDEGVKQLDVYLNFLISQGFIKK
jgi:hypothetical protein